MHERQVFDRLSARPMNQLQGIKSLHAACSTLLRTPPNLIRSVHVTIPLVHFPLPATSLVDLAERIATEYGVSATAQLTGQHVEVHLSRADRPLADGKNS